MMMAEATNVPATFTQVRREDKVLVTKPRTIMWRITKYAWDSLSDEDKARWETRTEDVKEMKCDEKLKSLKGK